MKSRVEILIFDSVDEYKEEYINVFVRSTYNLSGITVSFHEEDFDHIFSEPMPGDSGRVFSKRRAKKMLFMKAVIDGGVETEIMYETDSGNIAIFCRDLDCVMFLRMRKERSNLQVLTFFDFGKDHSKMLEKQRRKCKEITINDIKRLLSLGQQP